MNKERLLKLADHLDNGQLGHKKFDFRHFNRGATRDNPCGTSGCAIGECPIIFPNEWNFLETSEPESYNPLNPNPNPVLKGFTTPALSIIGFFNVSGEEVDIIFYPQSDVEGSLDYILINGKKYYALLPDANRYTVANHIREFVKLKELDDI